MEMNHSMAEVPRRTSLAPLASPYFVHCVKRVETEGLSSTRGGRGSFPWYGGTFARSYLVSTLSRQCSDSAQGSKRHCTVIVVAMHLLLPHSAQGP